MSAEVHITLRTTSMSGPAARVQPIPLETFAVNKDMGRLLLRRGGETVAAGLSQNIFSALLSLGSCNNYFGFL